MYIRIVTFGLADLPVADYQQQAAAIADGFTAWPGLLAKIWLADERRNRFGGVYIFESKDEADRSRTTALFAGLAGNPALSDLVIDEYDTLPGPTAITCPPIPGHATVLAWTPAAVDNLEGESRRRGRATIG
jgi:hypothetical protein